MEEIEHVEDVNNSAEGEIEDLSNQNLDDIAIKETTSQIDAVKYRDYKTKIVEVKYAYAIDYYTGPINDKGLAAYNPASTLKKKIIEVTTEPLHELDENGNPTEKIAMVNDKDGHQKPLTVTARFNLQKGKGPNGSIEWYISKAPRAKLWNFMRKYGAKTLSELKGKNVSLDAEPSADENDDRFWLRIK